MYKYDWDDETGGYLLTTTQFGVVGRELRPIYAAELDLLGFDKYWTYPKTPQTPLLWAENNNYIYHGEIVAKIWGGTYNKAPTIECFHEGLVIEPINIQRMVEKNQVIMDALVNDALRNIYSTYEKYRGKYDLFYVAFSGGKDSVVALDLVHRALSPSDYLVLFGNTDMELPDTYTFMDMVREHYSDVAFYEAKAPLSSEETWNIFGPPARTLRWCCSIHKTSPQIQFLRKHLGKVNFKGLAFTGIRGEESNARSEYDMMSFGKKHTGQDSFHPILSWNTAELYLYIFGQSLPMNAAYEKGCHRVGCLVCPMSGGRHEYVKMKNYPVEMQKYLDIIANTSSKEFDKEGDLVTFIDDGCWNLRKSGRELKHGQTLVRDLSVDDNLFILSAELHDESWKDWIKTLGVFSQIDEITYLLEYKENLYRFTVEKKDEKTVIVTLPITNRNGTSSKYFLSMLKSVFKKAAYCVKCGVCAAECKHGLIDLSPEAPQIVSDKCNQCLLCHKVNKGCLRYESIVVPLSESVKTMSGFDRYLTFGFKNEWLVEYFENPAEFWDENSLGSKMIPVCKRFLRDAGVLSEGKDLSITPLGAGLCKLGASSLDVWAIMFINAAYTRQIEWYVKNIAPGITYTKDDVMALLPDEIKPSVKSNIVDAYRNILKGTPIGVDLGVGVPFMSGNTMKSFTRKPWEDPSPLVILYSLFKYAEAFVSSGEDASDARKFTLTQLLLEDKDSVGLSPSLLFSLDKTTLQQIISGLSIEHPDFITSSFTHDLDNISLAQDKTSLDVISLCVGEM